MEKIAFIGGYDKADLLIYIAKTLTIMGKKVLIMDTTASQKTRYIVPTMQSQKQYITTFENVDIAIGFETFMQIKAYKSMQKTEQFDYDYALIDVDSYRGFYYSQIKTNDKKYFVTSLDIYSLRRGVQVFMKLAEKTRVTNVIFTKEELKVEEKKYLEFITKGLKIECDEEAIFFPFENGDQSVIFNNQRTGRIQIKGLSSSYIDALMTLIVNITGEKMVQIKKALKILDRN